MDHYSYGRSTTTYSSTLFHHLKIKVTLLKALANTWYLIGQMKPFTASARAAIRNDFVTRTSFAWFGLYVSINVSISVPWGWLRRGTLMPRRSCQLGNSNHIIFGTGIMGGNRLFQPRWTTGWCSFRGSISVKYIKQRMCVFRSRHRRQNHFVVVVVDAPPSPVASSVEAFR